jgi:hypothetical protein
MPLKHHRQIHALTLRTGPRSTNHRGRIFASNGSDEPKLDARLQAEIGAKLRSYYVDLVSEPVPQRFADLLAQLDRKH